MRVGDNWGWLFSAYLCQKDVFTNSSVTLSFLQLEEQLDRNLDLETVQAGHDSFAAF